MKNLGREEALQILDQVNSGMTYPQIAKTWQKQGYISGRGNKITAPRLRALVCNLRKKNVLKKDRPVYSSSMEKTNNIQVTVSDDSPVPMQVISKEERTLRAINTVMFSSAHVVAKIDTIKILLG